MSRTQTPSSPSAGLRCGSHRQLRKKKKGSIWLQRIHSLSFIFFFFFLRESFNLWRSLLMIAFYRQTKTPISFWYRRRLNPRSLIQPSETLPVELTEIHNSLSSICFLIRWPIKKKKWNEMVLLYLCTYRKISYNG